MQTELEKLKEENEELKNLNGRLNWRVEHARSQYFHFLEKSLPLIYRDTKRDIFIEQGRLCARSLGWANDYVGNPEGFFRKMNDVMGEEISLSEDKKTITVTTPERVCDCPILKERLDGHCIDGAFCDCSIGWQTETYETILEKKVLVQLKKAGLRGDGRCVFEINIMD